MNRLGLRTLNTVNYLVLSRIAHIATGGGWNANLLRELIRGWCVTPKTDAEGSAGCGMLDGARAELAQVYSGWPGSVGLEGG